MRHALALSIATSLFTAAALAESPANPFFVLSNGVADEKHATPESQAALLAELGYDGIGPSGTQGVPAMLAALDRHGLAMHALYVGANLDPDQPRYEPGLAEAIRQLKGRETFVWLYVRSAKFKRGSPDGDRRAAEIVGEVAGMAEQSGLRVALYPHTGFYVETVQDALRIAKRVDRPNMGVTFNLCHWLKVEGDHNLEARLEEARPHLLVVTINGADSAGADWKTLIQPLDRGDFDQLRLLRILQAQGFRGPIGLQCYAVPGDKRENLQRSMAAWRTLQARLETTR
jgi:sugar phosphate isomerase/epimerase